MNIRRYYYNGIYYINDRDIWLAQQSSIVCFLMLTNCNHIDKEEEMKLDNISSFTAPSNLNFAYRCFIKPDKFKTVMFNDLRHMLATYLLEQNLLPKIDSEKLGHSTIVSTSNTYSLVMSTMQEGAAKPVDKVIGRAK